MATRRERIESMLASEPDDPELRYFLAMDYVSAGQTEAAAAQLADLLALCPDYVPAYVQAGQNLARLGREDDARDVYRRGITAAQKKGDTHAAGEMEAFLDAIS